METMGAFALREDRKLFILLFRSPILLYEADKAAIMPISQVYEADSAAIFPLSRYQKQISVLGGRRPDQMASDRRAARHAAWLAAAGRQRLSLIHI